MNLNLIKGLSFADKLNMTEAITESGKEFLKNYRGFLYTNPASYGLVNGFIRESAAYKYDNGIATILESVLKYVTENKISWKLASACEIIENSNSQYDYIAKEGCKTAEKLLSMNEAEVVQYIKAGALKSIQYIPEFRNICKEVYGTMHVDEVRTTQYTLTSPISYSIIKENETWFAINGYSYCIKEGKVSQSKCDDADFNIINSLLPNFSKVDESLVYEWQANWNEPSYKFTISENEIKFEKGEGICESFNNVIDFKQYCDNFSSTLFGVTKSNFMNIAMNVARVQEGFDNICEVDTAKVLECANGTIANIVEANDNVNLTWVRSTSGCTSNEFEYMHEALDQVQKMTNVNLRSSYEARINEDIKKEDPESYANINEQLKATKDAKIEERRQKIQQLAEAYKNDPTKIAILSSLSKELALLENK